MLVCDTHTHTYTHTHTHTHTYTHTHTHTQVCKMFFLFFIHTRMTISVGEQKGIFDVRKEKYKFLNIHTDKDNFF
jgi:hypothetical protein